MNLLLLLLTLSARAGAPLVYTGDPAEATARIRKATRERELELDPHRLVDLAPGVDPYVIGQPATLRCAPGKLSAIQEDIENALANLARNTDAMAALDLARLDLECLGEPVDPALAARLFFLRGFISWRKGDDASAESGFYRAFLFDPALSWDEELGGPRPPAAFSRAQARAQGPERAWLRIIPDPAPGFELRVDGRPMAPTEGRLSLRPGVHLVQVVADGFTAPPLLLPIDAGQERALVLPVALSERLLGELDQPAVRAALAPLLEAAWPTTTSYVSGPGGVWRYDPSTRSWESL